MYKGVIIFLALGIIGCNTEDKDPKITSCIEQWVSSEIDGWNERYVDHPAETLMSFPLTFDSNEVGFGDDSWVFQTLREDQKISFYMEQGPGSGYEPGAVNEPLPSQYLTYDNLIKIYSYFDQDNLIGAFYYSCNNESKVRQISGVFLKKEGSTFKEILFVGSASSEIAEALTILSTVK